MWRRAEKIFVPERPETPLQHQAGMHAICTLREDSCFGVAQCFSAALSEKTIIPIAKIAYGFGAGAGTGGMGDTKPKGEGGGGAGGVRAIPIGVFEVSARETKFVAIHDRKKTLATLLAGPALGVLFARRRRIR